MKRILIDFAGLILISGYMNAQPNTLTQQEINEGWKLLFNGQNLDGWITVRNLEPPTSGWVVENGVLIVNKGGPGRGGDIITKDQYSDFDLIVEFKITKGANSGIKYFHMRYEEGGWLGLEYQILDDETHPDAKLGRPGTRLQAGLYDMFPPSENKKDSPIGEWNQARIVAQGTKVTHYLNGQEVLTFNRLSKEYRDAYELSKYKGSVPVFGHVEQGHILLQDHQDEVAFRNIKIRVLK
jgi:hypothetical protein